MDIALDLGTANARLRIKDSENAIDQPSVIAYNKDNNEILAVGEEAYAMLGKTSSKINVIFPLEGGVIAESGLVEEMVNIASSCRASSPVFRVRSLKWKSARSSARSPASASGAYC